MNFKQIGLCIVFCSTLARALAEDSGNVIPFQGQLANQTGQPLFPSNAVTFVFRLYAEAIGGVAIWEESQPNISVLGSRFSVLLGSRTRLPDESFFRGTIYVGITVDDGNPQTADVEMRPRQAIVPVISASLARNAGKLNGHDWSAVFDTNNPAVGKISGAKIADAAITTRTIQNGAVTAATIADGSVQSAKIGDLQVVTRAIEDLAVTSSKIADGAILAGKIQDGAITSSKLAPALVSDLSCLCAQSASISSNLQLILQQIQNLQTIVENPWVPYTNDILGLCFAADMEKWQYAVALNSNVVDNSTSDPYRGYRTNLLSVGIYKFYQTDRFGRDPVTNSFAIVTEPHATNSYERSFSMGFGVRTMWGVQRYSERWQIILSTIDVNGVDEPQQETAKPQVWFYRRRR